MAGVYSRLYFGSSSLQKALTLVDRGDDPALVVLVGVRAGLALGEGGAVLGAAGLHLALVGPAAPGVGGQVAGLMPKISTMISRMMPPMPPPTTAPPGAPPLPPDPTCEVSILTSSLKLIWPPRSWVGVAARCSCPGRATVKLD